MYFASADESAAIECLVLFQLAGVLLIVAGNQAKNCFVLLQPARSASEYADTVISNLVPAM